MIVSRLVATFAILGLGLAMSYVYLPEKPDAAAAPPIVDAAASTEPPGSLDQAATIGSDGAPPTAKPTPGQAITELLAVVAAPSHDGGGDTAARGPFGELVQPNAAPIAGGAVAVQASVAASPAAPSPIGGAGITGDASPTRLSLPVEDIRDGAAPAAADKAEADKTDAKSDQEESEAAARARRSYRNVSRAPQRRPAKPPE